jgi:hypothetical protein
MRHVEPDTHYRKAPTQAPVRRINHPQQPRFRSVVRATLSFVIAVVPMMVSAAKAQPFLPDITISSTVPVNGDTNPYGVAFVPPGFPSGGPLKPGDILVSNFNNGGGAQGTGTTIIQLRPNGLVAASGTAITFFQGTPAPFLGLTTALGVLQGGFVLVGNVPTDSNGVIQQPGSLLVVDRFGNQKSSITSQLNGPWDLTIDDFVDHATVFVSNVNTGSVTRLNLAVSPKGVSVNSATVIAQGYTVVPNKAALILGPTGLAHDTTTDILYVASTADNAIFAVPNASTRTGPPAPAPTGRVIFKDNHLRGPLALVFAPNGDLITSNGDAVNADPTQPSEIVEFTKGGKFVSQFNVDAGQGGAFGIGVAPVSLGLGTFRLAAVDDNANDIIVIDQNLVPSD